MMMGGRRVRRSGRGHSLLPLSSRHHRHHNHHPANTISCWYITGFHVLISCFKPFQSPFHSSLSFVIPGTTSIESSEGIRVEYIAIFLAIIFPGAVVAFNYEVVQSLPHSSLLRIYCAGIWHNAVSCAVCGLALIFLPLILFPLYIHGESPMVLGLSSTSPLFGYLSPGDSIVSLDGIRIHDPHEWMKMITLIDEQTHQNSNYSDDARSVLTLGGRKGYCVPSSLLDKSVKIQLEDSQFVCPDELSAFVKFSCFNSSLLDNGYHENGKWGANCLTAKHVVKLNKCGDGWPAAVTSRSSCECSQDQSCLMPAQVPGVTWVEIAYSNPYSLECLQKGENSSADIEGPESVITNCGGTFVFIGDAHSMGHSVQLTAYQPRWAFFLGAYLPNTLEKILVCTFHVSLTLAFLNSLPVFFLDGESILEVIVCNITFLSARKREKIFQICLLGGTLFSILAISRISLSIFL
ncbi:PREDICTED: membrane-bound transcription factor site-2 protease homolog isoform X2 [Nelumbo nucifera]|uniref:Endopeptidase S2P n=2 Tax=Nelumbo nucifera TaxID=4432 RepID=A0A822ZG63_NELNU|nr:PREDICTED: membrane-bound transcription factor site-2 protease homolog isoform X2 [Nelumbo nucifera]DAD44122.1 TPA_asm: hypothetical protein HUJ06_002352 [Nelumbo nucifera]